MSIFSDVNRQNLDQQTSSEGVHKTMSGDRKACFWDDPPSDRTNVRTTPLIPASSRTQYTSTTPYTRSGDYNGDIGDIGRIFKRINHNILPMSPMSPL